LDEILKYYDTEGLKARFNIPNPSWKVDRIIVTQGCTDEIPKELLKALKTVLSLYDPDTGKKKCKIIFTKYSYFLAK
jgi:hypothetical protein